MLLLLLGHDVPHAWQPENSTRENALSWQWTIAIDMYV